MIVFGLISSVFDLVTFAALLLVFHADQPTFQTFWFIVSLLTELAVVLILRTRDRLSQQAQSPAVMDHACSRSRDTRNSVPRALEFDFWLCATISPADGHGRCDRH